MLTPILYALPWVILPGVIGAPFLATGIAVLAPGGPQLLTRWVRRNPNAVVLLGLKQMARWLDDLERRYPRQQRHDAPAPQRTPAASFDHLIGGGR